MEIRIVKLWLRQSILHYLRMKFASPLLLELLVCLCLCLTVPGHPAPEAALHCTSSLPSVAVVTLSGERRGKVGLPRDFTWWLPHTQSPAVCYIHLAVDLFFLLTNPPQWQHSQANKPGQPPIPVVTIELQMFPWHTMFQQSLVWTDWLFRLPPADCWKNVFRNTNTRHLLDLSVKYD